MLAEPEAGSPKFHEKLKPVPVEVFVNDIGIFAQTLLLLIEKLATGTATVVTCMLSVLIHPLASSIVKV